MKQEIKEIIQKNLPAQVGEVLRETLEQAEKDAEQVKILSENINKKTFEIKNLHYEIEEYRKFDERNQQLEQREKDVANKERNLTIQQLTYELNSEKEKTQFSKDVALGLVRNTEFRKSIFDNTTEPGGKDQYGNQYYVNKTQNSTEKKTIE